MTKPSPPTSTAAPNCAGEPTKQLKPRNTRNTRKGTEPLPAPGARRSRRRKPRMEQGVQTTPDQFMFLRPEKTGRKLPTHPESPDSSNGVASESSPRREPWVQRTTVASPGGAAERRARRQGHIALLPPRCGSPPFSEQPTAHAVGYSLTQLRCWAATGQSPPRFPTVCEGRAPRSHPLFSCVSCLSWFIPFPTRG